MHLARPPIPSTWRFRSLILSDGLFVPICLRFNSLQLLLKQAPLYMEPSCLFEVQIQGILRSCDSHYLGIVVSNIERFHLHMHLETSKAPVAYTSIGDLHGFNSLGIRSTKHTTIQPLDGLGDRLMSDVPLDAHAPITACSGYGFWKLIPI